MKTARTRLSESDVLLNSRLAFVTTVLLIGALLACFPTKIRAAEPFGRGNVTGSIYVGAGRALDFVSKCITVCDDSANAGHGGSPGPFGSPVFAKFTK